MEQSATIYFDYLSCNQSQASYRFSFWCFGVFPLSSSTIGALHITASRTHSELDINYKFTLLFFSWLRVYIVL